MTEKEWEQLFPKRNICPTCGNDITFDRCDCKDYDLKRSFDDPYED